MLQTIDIRGVPIANTTKAELLSELRERLRQGRQTLLFTPNAEILQHAAESESFRSTLTAAYILFADGTSVLKAAEILGKHLPEKIAGVEVGEAVTAESILPVYLLGGNPGVAEKAAENLRNKYPDCRIAGTHDGYFSASGDENDHVISSIRRSGAGILLVCLGSPKQEQWCVSNRASLPSVTLWMALGGSLDVYAGVEKRAPEWMIRRKLEWLWRLARHPKRFKRMMKIPKYLSETRRYARKHPADAGR